MREDSKQYKLRKLFEAANTIIFDFDGVLADSEKVHYQSYSDVFKKYGHTIDEAEYYKHWTSLGEGARGEIERYGLNLDPIAIRDEKRPIFSQYCEDGSIKLFPEAEELLVRLKKNTDKVLTIASGTVRPDIEAILSNAGYQDYFSEIIGSDTVPAIKPAPDIFLKMLDTVHREPWECLVIEDAEKGMHAAITALIPVIVIRTEETRGFDFSLADLVLDSHEQMIRMVREFYPLD